MIDPTEADTAEMPAYNPLSAALWPATSSVRVQVDFAALSHQGLVRTNNEDHYLVVRFGRALEALLTNLPDNLCAGACKEVGYGMVVADGMGGAAAGEVASRTAISTLVSLVLHTPDWILSDGDRATEQVMERMAERYRRVHTALRDQGSEDPGLAGMGTTMTMACSFGASLVIGHVGDSRAYLYRGGELLQLTRDHTLVQGLIEAGSLSPAEAAVHPLRHVLTRSLGSGPGRLDADFQRAWLCDNDQLVLCTDGLTDMVNDAAIAAVLSSAATADEACQALVSTALRSGGKDNVTVVVARYRLPGRG
jgi:protein phosphatase